MIRLQNTKMVTANMLIARQKKSASVIKVDYSKKQKWHHKVRRGHNKTPATRSTLEAFGHLFKLTQFSVMPGCCAPFVVF